MDAASRSTRPVPPSRYARCATSLKPEFRRRGDGRRSGLRKAAVPSACASPFPVKAAAPTSFLLQDETLHGFGAMVDSIVCHGRRPAAGSTSVAAKPARPQISFRPAMRRQRCFFRCHRKSGCGILPGLAGACGRHGDVFGGDRGSRRDLLLTLRAVTRRSVVRSCARWPGTTIISPWRGGPQREHHSRQQEGGLANIVEKSLGSIVKSGTSPIVDVLEPGRAGRARRARLRGDPGQRLHMRHASTRAGYEPASVHDRPGDALRACSPPVIKVATRTELASAGPTSSISMQARSRPARLPLRRPDGISSSSFWKWRVAARKSGPSDGASPTISRCLIPARLPKRPRNERVSRRRTTSPAYVEPVGRNGA